MIFPVTKKTNYYLMTNSLDYKHKYIFKKECQLYLQRIYGQMSGRTV